MSSSPEHEFVLGLDLDGCVADFLEGMKRVFAEWSGQDPNSLDPEPSYGFPEWGLDLVEYKRLHRFAVTQRNLFESMPPVHGAPQSLRRLSAEGIRIRIATHRLFIPYFHEPAASQTIRWLENHGIPYWDLCLIEDKAAVAANVFVEDTARNIERLQAREIPVICFTNPSNEQEDVSAPRARTWVEAENMIRAQYYEWRERRNRPVPEHPGRAAAGEEVHTLDEICADG